MDRTNNIQQKHEKKITHSMKCCVVGFCFCMSILAKAHMHTACRQANGNRNVCETCNRIDDADEQWRNLPSKIFLSYCVCGNSPIDFFFSRRLPGRWDRPSERTIAKNECVLNYLLIALRTSHAHTFFCIHFAYVYLPIWRCTIHSRWVLFVWVPFYAMTTKNQV